MSASRGPATLRGDGAVRRDRDRRRRHGHGGSPDLAERGRSTLLLERFTFGHGAGSSGGPTRIFRYNYADPAYVAMAKLAAELWRELEDVAGVELFRVTGGIDVGAAAREPAATVAACGMPIELAHARDVMERWPALRFPDDAELYVQDDGGVLRAEATVRAQVTAATRAGAIAREGVRVTALRRVGDGVEVRTDGHEGFAAGVAVVAAGAWAPGVLAGAGIDFAVAPSFEQVTYFALDEASPLPTVIERWDDGVHAGYAVPDPWIRAPSRSGCIRAGSTCRRMPTTHPPRSTASVSRKAARTPLHGSRRTARRASSTRASTPTRPTTIWSSIGRDRSSSPRPAAATASSSRP